MGGGGTLLSLHTICRPSAPQTILCGMGELHIEIVHDRIRREYGIETYLGPLQVAYRESILNEASATGGASCQAWFTLFVYCIPYCRAHLIISRTHIHLQ